MKIVIAGIGDMGFHLAKLLASEKQDIVLVDLNDEILEYAATHLDVLTMKGDSSSLATLEAANVDKADIFLAVTTYQNTNIVSCQLAKLIGAKKTIARVSSEEYLLPSQTEAFMKFGVDKIISPIQLATNEISRLIDLCEVTDNFEFEEGKISLIGITLDNDSPYIGKTLKEMDIQYPSLKSRPIAILRGHETILPRSNTRLQFNDHVYFITLKKEVENLLSIVGKVHQPIKRIMVIGSTYLAYATCKELESKYSVTLVSDNKTFCKTMIERLDSTLIIKGDPGNLELLSEEGLANMDAFIAVTPNSETNIIASLMAEQKGVFKTIALVDNTDYTHISQHIGVDTIINKKLIAANNVFRYVRQGEIEAITSLHGVDAEVIEYVLNDSSKLINKPLRLISFPFKSIIGAVIRGEKSIIPNGDFELQRGDKIIVLGVSEAIPKLDDLFR